MTEIRNNAEDCLMTLVRETADNRVVAVMNLAPRHPCRLLYGHLRRDVHRRHDGRAFTELRGRVEEDMAPWSYRILCN